MAWEIFKWPIIDETPDIIKICLRHRQEDMAIYIIRNHKIIPTQQDLKFAVLNRFFNLAVEILKYRSTNSALWSYDL